MSISRYDNKRSCSLDLDNCCGCGMEECLDGEWVRYEAHAAEIVRLRELCRELRQFLVGTGHLAYCVCSKCLLRESISNRLEEVLNEHY